MNSTNINQLLDYYNKRQLQKPSFIPEINNNFTKSQSYCIKLKGISLLHNQLQLLELKNHRDRIYLQSQLHKMYFNFSKSNNNLFEEKKQLNSKDKWKEAGIQTIQQNYEPKRVININLPTINKAHLNSSIAFSVHSIINHNLINESIITALPKINNEPSVILHNNMSLLINDTNNAKLNLDNNEGEKEEEVNNDQIKENEVNLPDVNENNIDNNKNENELIIENENNTQQQNDHLSISNTPNESEIILHDINGDKINEKDDNTNENVNKQEQYPYQDELIKIKEDLKELQNAFNDIQSLTKKSIELRNKRASKSINLLRNTSIIPDNSNKKKLKTDYYHNIYLSMSKKDPLALSKKLSHMIDKRLQRNQSQLDLICNKFNYNKKI